MKIHFNLIVLLFLLGSTSIAQQTTTDFTKLTGSYLGQKPQGMTPELFAPGILSTKNTEWTLTFMHGGYEAYYNIKGLNGYNHLMCVKRINGVWQQTVLAPFSNPNHNADPYISPDGKKLFFWSNGVDDNNNTIWYMNRAEDDWSKPIRIDSVINTKHWQIFPTVSSNGNLYFSCNYPDTKGSFDIYKSEFVNGKYTETVNLGDSMKTGMLEQEPYNIFLVKLSYWL
jgi:hypothetical protein